MSAGFLTVKAIAEQDVPGWGRSAACSGRTLLEVRKLYRPMHAAGRRASPPLSMETPMSVAPEAASALRAPWAPRTALPGCPGLPIVAQAAQRADVCGGFASMWAAPRRVVPASHKLRTTWCGAEGAAWLTRPKVGSWSGHGMLYRAREP